MNTFAEYAEGVTQIRKDRLNDVFPSVLADLFTHDVHAPRLHLCRAMGFFIREPGPDKLLCGLIYEMLHFIGEILVRSTAASQNP